jgi:hypothetical protein
MKNQSDVHDVARKDQSQSSTNESQPEGVSWQFYFIVGVIALGVLGLVGKAFGLF